MKEYVLSKIGNVSKQVRAVFEKTDSNHMVCSPLRLRNPLEFMYRNISKDNVCIAGDALHPMTPDMGQGACSALEDSVVLARVLAEALAGKERINERWRIKKGLEKFARERKWRSFDLVSTSYVVGFIQQRDGAVMNFLKNRVLGKYLSGVKLKKANFDVRRMNNMIKRIDRTIEALTSIKPFQERKLCILPSTKILNLTEMAEILMNTMNKF